MSKRPDRKRKVSGDAASLQLIVALVRPRGEERLPARGRMSVAPGENDDVGELSAARVLVARGEATGGVLCAWAGDQLAFAFEPSALDAAIDLALHARTREPWSIALVEGHCEIDPAQSRPRLAIGWALTRALDLAQIGRAGDVLIDRRLTAMREGDINRTGWRHGRDLSGQALRGALLDVEQPWARDVPAHEGHFVTPPLVGRPDPRSMLASPGTLAILRANPGMGGSRFLGEIRAHVPPGMSLLLTPTVTTLEPLGALRAAMLRALAEGETDEIEPELVPAREHLLQGEGVTIDMAATLIAAQVTRGDLAGAVFIDDASEIDASSLEACTRALFLGRFNLIARIDADSQIPALLGGLTVGPEIELGPLSREHAEKLAAASTGGALDREGQRRWARLGGNAPLGILASLRASLAQGELAWVGKYAYPRRRSSGTGQVTHPSFWIARSAALASMPAQCVLAVITLAGGEATVHATERALEAAGAPVVARTEIDAMLASGWLIETAPGWIALPTRTHRDAVLGELMDEETRHATHQALASSLGEHARGIGLAEVAFHAARGGDGKRAAKAALQAARQANLVGLAAGATQLIALAKREDPTCEEEAHRQLETSIASGRAAMSEPARKSSSDALMAVRVLPTERAEDPRDREEEWEDDAPTIGPTPVGNLPKAMLPFSEKPDRAPPAKSSRAGVAGGLSWLAREALASADPAALEQWTASLRATGEHPRYAERLQALARLTRGEVGDALRILRGARAELEGESGGVRTQASLALAVALASSGRIDEALLETLDGLARARVGNDVAGSRACLAFLSKLYKLSGRNEGAREIRTVLEQTGGIERSAE